MTYCSVEPDTIQIHEAIYNQNTMKREIMEVFCTLKLDDRLIPRISPLGL